MPQIGQLPGASRTICGCIGQVHSTFVGAAVGATGSSAMPHFGQAPGFDWRTSGCMGHVYSTPSVADGITSPRFGEACVRTAPPLT
jgi:hypothetical protein